MKPSVFAAIPFPVAKGHAPFAGTCGLSSAEPTVCGRFYCYNQIMARGWESKSVEAQIESAATRQAVASEPELAPEQLQMLRDKENLELSRTRVQRELAASQNPRYQQILRKALADLEAKLMRLEPAQSKSAAAAQ
jgi:hypothetical protein